MLSWCFSVGVGSRQLASTPLLVPRTADIAPSSAFNLEFYTEVQDLHQLLPLLNSSSFTSKYTKLNEALVEMIESFNLVAFYTLQIEDKHSVLNLARVVDKANGYAFGGLDEANESVMAAGGGRPGELEDVSWVQEKYLRNESDGEKSERTDSDEAFE